MAKVRLFDAQGKSKDVGVTTDNIPNNFVKAEVFRGQWIAYDNENFNGGVPNPDANDIQVLKTDGTQIVALLFYPRSIKLVAEGIELFTLPFYGGKSKLYKKTDPVDDLKNITKDFPDGASSALVNGDKDWSVFGAIDWKLPTLRRGCQYNDPAAMGLGSKPIFSIKPQP